jgi:DNA modification methylase
VLRDDGSWWLNLGDSFDNKQKQLVPHRVAIALQDNGWVCRNDVTWTKPNPMPSSVTDRLNTTTEQIFHLTPERDYWYDLYAIRSPYSESMERRKEYQSKHGGHETDGWSGGNHHQSGGLLDDSQTYADHMNPAGKNPGDVFEVTTKPFADAHFAVYPPELCRKPIKATCPPKVCAECGAPYERDVERNTTYDHDTTDTTGTHADRNDLNGGDGHDLRNGVYSNADFKGWLQLCDCDTDATEPGIALDPFAGAGTTLMVAKELGRQFVGIELNPEYADMARSRVGLDLHDPAHARDDEAQHGFEAYE